MGQKKPSLTNIGTDRYAQNVVISDADGDLISFDDTTGALITIEYAHHEIHSGSHFFYDDVHALAKNGSIEHLIITPNTTKWAHMIIEVDAHGGQVELEVFEAPTVTDIGTIEPMFNRNRNSDKTPTTLLYETPSTSADGLRIDHKIFGIDDKKSAAGGNRSNNEIILKQNTSYLIRIKENDVAISNINLTVDWYEHTNK